MATFLYRHPRRDRKSKGRRGMTAALLLAALAGACLAALAVAPLLAVSEDASAGNMSKTVWGYIYDYEANPVPDILVTVNILIGETTTIRSTLTDTTGPADSTPTGFYTVTFPPEEWMEGDTVEVIVSYPGDQEIVTEVITEEGDEEIDVYLEVVIPEFDIRMTAMVTVSILVAAMGLLRCGRRRMP